MSDLLLRITPGGIPPGVIFVYLLWEKLLKIKGFIGFVIAPGI